MRWRLVLALGVAMAAAQQPSYAQGVASEAHDEGAETEEEEIVVQATRSGRRLQDEPVRVEVITREEIEEKF